MTGFDHLSRIGRLAAWGAIGAASLAGGAIAQTGSAPASRAVVQPLPSEWTSELNAALRRLAANPADAAALLQAGKASLKLGDIDAATGFFTRAQQNGAAGGQAAAGLAATQVHQKRPVEALELFAQAERNGASLSAYAGEYGLAYDLVGDNARAQQYYRMALAEGPDPEITRRLALSLAIAGDRAASEAALLPQLQRQDLAGYRTRAFALAVLGRTEEAVAIVDVVMPASLASKISPYLRYMPRLTRAQQAAAGNFGHFPDAASIGQDDPRIAAYANAAVGQAATPGLDTRLIPSGEPLGQTRQNVSPAPATQAVSAQAQITQAPNTAPAVATPAVASAPPRLSAAASSVTAQGQPAASRNSVLGVLPGTRTAEILGVSPAARTGDASELQPVASAPIPPSPAPSGELPPVPGQESPAPMPPPAQAPLPAPQQASIPAPTPVPAPAPVTAPAAPAPTQIPSPAPAAEPRSLAQAFADFGPPETAAAPAPGAVDITAIKPAREVVKKPEPPPKPVIPSRIWVQVATGKDRSALAFDWRRISRSADKLMTGKSAFIAKWGQTNRLVTGPFASQGAAAAFVKDLKAAGIDSFTFTSAEGEALDPLPGR